MRKRTYYREKFRSILFWSSKFVVDYLKKPIFCYEKCVGNFKIFYCKRFFFKLVKFRAYAFFIAKDRRKKVDQKCILQHFGLNFTNLYINIRKLKSLFSCPSRYNFGYNMHILSLTSWNITKLKGRQFTVNDFFNFYTRLIRPNQACKKKRFRVVLFPLPHFHIFCLNLRKAGKRKGLIFKSLRQTHHSDGTVSDLSDLKFGD